jgi:hypothetical protein
MIDTRLYLNPTEEEKKYFYNTNIILPIDDKLLYNGSIYQLTNFDIKTLNLPRIDFGYPKNYSGIEKNPGDANLINGMDMGNIKMIIKFIENEIENNLPLTRKKIG